MGGNVIKDKSRLVAHGFLDTDPNLHTYSSVARLEEIRLLLAISTIQKFKVALLDVQQAYTNALLPDDQRVYMRYFQGYEQLTDKKKKPNHCLAVMRSLYGLRQSGRLWNIDEITSELAVKLRLHSTPLPANFNNREQNGLNDEPLSREQHSLYRSIIGSLQWISNASRADLSFTVSSLAQKCHQPTKPDLQHAYHCLGYIQQAGVKTLIYRDRQHLDLTCYVDSDDGADHTRRSRTGYLIYLGGNLISWRSRLQDIVSLSSCESELVALTDATKEVKYIRMLLEDLNITPSKTTVFCDSQAALKLVYSTANWSRTKHISRRYRWLQDELQRTGIEFQYIRSDQNVADLLTKSTTYRTFSNLSTNIFSQ